MSRAQASSIEDQFVDAVRGALETAPDWSAEPVTILRRTVQGHIEMVKFDDSSYMSRAAYRSYCERSDSCPDQRRISEDRPDPPRILGQVWLAAPSKGGFFVRCIQPRFNVKKLGRSRRMCIQLKSRRQIP